MKLEQLVTASLQVGRTTKRLQKVGILAQCLAQLSDEELSMGINLLAGQLPQGRVGVGWASLYAREGVAPATEASLTLLEVAHHLEVVASSKGAGSVARREEELGRMFARATLEEQEFLRGLMAGGIRQGALEAIVLDATARAYNVALDAVRHAHMFAADLATVARAARQGEAALAAFSLQLFKPVLPMLAHPADGVEDALQRLGTASLELKLDGARVQVHRVGDEVRIFSRELNEVTAALPEVVAAVRSMDARELILDGEVVAMRPDGTPHAFQTTMRRFGRKQADAAMQQELPMRAWFFDCMYLDGKSLTNQDTGARFAALEACAAAELRIPRLVTADVEAAGAFLKSALDQGHEGVMAKSLAGPYQAGKRGQSWLKIKKAHTLDLVVLAVEWGSGRRQGSLSNIHLGARDVVNGGFVMLGKTFKGMTDEMLRWQTERFLGLEIGREGHVVHVKPEQVVEVAFSDVQVSTHYPGGMALRLARVKRYRPDKPASAADTVESVRALLPRP